MFKLSTSYAPTSARERLYTAVPLGDTPVEVGIEVHMSADTRGLWAPASVHHGRRASLAERVDLALRSLANAARAVEESRDARSARLAMLRKLAARDTVELIAKEGW